MRNADILIPRGLDNVVGIDMLTSHVQKQLAKKSDQHITDFLALTSGEENSASRKRKSLSSSIVILQQTPQIQAINTILFDHKTIADDFIFYFDRMAGIIINRALDEFCENMAPAKTIETPTGHHFNGISLPFDNICAITIIRGGECFNTALRSTVPNLRLGRLLLQSDSRTGEPRLHTMSLPPCIDPKPDGPSGDISKQRLEDLTNTHVLLVDSQISSGAATTMAVAILNDHGVKSENIICISYIASEIGLRRLSYAHPKLKIVVGRLEKAVTNRYIDTLYYRT